MNSFSLYRKYQLNIIKKTKKSFEKRHVKGIKIFLKKKKEKSKKRSMKGIKMFLKKKKKKIVNIIVNAIIENKDRKQRLVEYRKNYYRTYKK